MQKTTKILLNVALILIMVQSAYGQQVYSVGIPTKNFDYFAASQRNSNWCWAASMQMIFNYYGVNITQEQIVARSYGVDPYGSLPNWTGSFQLITANLNNWSIDNMGRRYAVGATLNGGAPTPTYLIQELTAQRPVLVGYRTGPNSGHAVVITALTYTSSALGPIIQTITVRDPYPTTQNTNSRGKVEYPGAGFANLIQAHWYIRIR